MNSPAASLLTPEQLAERLQVPVAWIYRHASKWPFTRKLTRKCLRFDAAGFEVWLQRQRG